MADNPLFPGYIPRKEGDTPNPLFPGYSQGQRAYKPPTGVPLGKYEYNTDYWLEQLDQMSFDAGNLPKWFLDRYVDDFKNTLKASYSLDSVPLEQMDDYDQDVMPGVSNVSLSLDPTEWKEPGTVLEKTAKSWIKAGTGLRFQKKGWGLEAWPIDLTDYDTRIKTALWKEALGIQPDISNLGKTGGRAVAGATRALAGDTTYGRAIFNFSDAEYEVAGKRGYETMAYNAVDAQRFMQSQKRDSKHDAFLTAMTASMKEEIGKNKDLFAELYTGTAKQDFKDAAEIFTLKQKLVGDMGVKDGNLSGPFGITSFLKARLSDSADSNARGDVLDGNSGTQTRFEAKIELAKKDISAALAPSGKDSIDEVVANIRKIDVRSAASVQKSADKYKAYLAKAYDVLDKYDGDDRKLYNNLSNITVNGRRLTGGGLLDPSIQRDLLRQLSSDVIIPGKLTRVDPKYQLGTYLKDLEHLASTERDKNGNLVIEEVFKNNGQPYKGFFGNQARIVATRLEMDRGSYAIEEFYDAVTEGRFMERYVWNILSKKLVGYTPGELVQLGLGKVGYFGLRIDDDLVSEHLRNNPVFNKLFRYKFRIEVGGEKLEIAGGKHLLAVDSLDKLLALKDHFDEKTELGMLITGELKLVDATGALNPAVKNKVFSFWEKDSYLARRAQEELDAFRKWVVDNKPLGIDMKDFSAMTHDEQQKLLDLFNGLRKEHKFYGSVKITSEYAGVIDRIGMNLNKLQNRIFGSQIFQKTIRPILQIKTIISENVSEVAATIITELLKKALHALTSGSTAVLDYLLEEVLKPLVRSITRKVVEFGQNFVGALAQGDISKAMAQIDKEIGQVVKFSMYVIGIPLILIYILVYGLFGTVLSSVSPIDPTRDNSGYGGTGAGLPQGENALIKIEKDVVVTFSNGATETNPVGSIENSELGITVNYIIKITPKVSIEGESVIFSDVVTKITTNGEQTVTTLADNQNLGTFTAGETYTVISDPVSIGSGFENSLVKNTLSVDTPAFQGTAAETVTFVRYLRIGTPPVPMDCFVFSGFSGNELANFEASLWNISGITGTFLSTLCSDDKKITLSRVSGGGDYCGFASGTGVITFNDTCTSYYTRLNATSYLLAHELGHIYNFWRLNTSAAVPGFPGGFDSVKGLEGGLTLPTYDGNCTTNNSVGEDFAETIGDMVAINSFGSCSATAALTYPLGDYDAFWNKFPVHRRFAQEVIFVR